MKLVAMALSATLACGTLYAQNVEIKDAWARASVPGQQASGAFMKITAREGATLVAVSSPAAGVTQVHEMRLDGDVMRMRAVPALALPPGKTVELKPGGYHIMLLDLKAPLVRHSTVALTLVFQDAKGAQSQVDLKVPVVTAAPGGTVNGHTGGDHSQHNPQ